MTDMRIVTTTSVFPRGYDLKTAMERLCRVGFDSLDMAFDYQNYSDDAPFMRDDWQDWIKEIKKEADLLGLTFTHSHAPGDIGEDELLERTLHAASLLGAKYTVVHPITCDSDGADFQNPERFIEVNEKAYREWLWCAEKYDMVILTENLLDDISANPETIAHLVKVVGSDRFGWCYDTGHANCSEYRQSVLKKCVVSPLSLHIQDNDSIHDSHLIPGDGTIDWDEFADAIKSVGYNGDCVLEAHHQCIDSPDEKREEVLSHLLDVAKVIRQKMEN